MTTQRTESFVPEIVTPKDAITMLLSGLMSPADAAAFVPGQVTVQNLIRIMRRHEDVVNRNVSEPQVERYIRDMQADHWLWTGDPIRIDHDGIVRDGQHRLLAVVGSNKPQKLLIIRDVDPSIQRVIDTGRPRSARDQVSLAGVTNSSAVTSASRLLIRYRSGRILDSAFQPSVSELLELIESDQGDLIQEAARRARATRNYITSPPLTALATWYVEAYQLNADLADEIMNSIETGENLARGNPILTLRNSICNYNPSVKKIRHGAVGQLWQLIRTWNAVRRNEDLMVIRVPTNLTSATFPKLG